MKFELKNKVVVITGASSGIGAATAVEMSKRQAHVVLASRNYDQLKKVATQCDRYSKTLIIPTDVSREEECKSLMDTAVKAFGRIDVLICNAGLSMRGLVQDTETSVFERLMNVNFWGVFYCTRYALPHLLKSKGMLIGISSVSGFKALPGRGAYTASKHAVNGFLECVKIENLQTGVHVMTFCPGFTATNIRHSALDEHGREQAESPRNELAMMRSEEVACTLCKSIEERKDFVVLTKQGKIMYWLDKFAPNFVSRKVFEEFARETNSPLRTEPLN